MLLDSNLLIVSCALRNARSNMSVLSFSSFQVVFTREANSSVPPSTERLVSVVLSCALCMRKPKLLKQNGKYDVAAIVTQIAKGNGAMPAFGERISPEDMSDVAAYVRDQAEKGW